MKRNEGGVDRGARGVLGVLTTLSGAALDPSSLTFELIGISLIVTALVGWCPIYALLHVDTASHAKR